MTGAMYAAIAGLKAHMQNLNVIGNNIANINTDGYKAGRSIFESALYTSLRSGSDGTSRMGGSNPAQIGYGSKLATVDINMSGSNYKPTGKDTDCFLDGDGFFLLGDKTLTFSNPNDFKALTLTRVGDLEYKADGYLSNRAGDVVYGFACLGYADDGKTQVVSNQLGPLSLPRMDENGNLVYRFNNPDYTATGEDNDPYIYVVLGNTEGTAYEEAGDDADALTDWYDSLAVAEFDSISISTNGMITGNRKDTSQDVCLGYIAIGNVTNPNGVTQISGTQYKAGQGSGDLTISMLGGSAADVYEFDVRDLENYEFNYAGGDNDDEIASVDTWSSDTWSRLSYINGTGGADADEDVTVPTGMQIRTGGKTGIITAGLEQTDVDLATEISNMITTQRGYQANTRIITVTDSMLEELVNMKRG